MRDDTGIPRRTLLQGAAVLGATALAGGAVGATRKAAFAEDGKAGAAPQDAEAATSQGGMQALSRSQFGRMIPPQRSNEFFGFFDVFGKFAAVLGPFLYALVVTASGRSSLGVLSLSLLFATGMLLLLLTPKSAFQNQKPLSAAPMPAADAAAGTAPGAAAPGQK